MCVCVCVGVRVCVCVCLCVIFTIPVWRQEREMCGLCGGVDDRACTERRVILVIWSGRVCATRDEAELWSYLCLPALCML